MGQIFGIKKKINGKRKKVLPEKREANLLFSTADRSRAVQSDVLSKGVQGILKDVRSRRGVI